jgi:hypothetical protein
MSEDVVSTELVKRSMSSVYPEGDATLAWQALRERYEPRNVVDQQTLLTELFASKLTDTSKDPEVWILLILHSGLTDSHKYGPGASRCVTVAQPGNLHTRRKWPLVTIASKLTLPLVTIANQFTVFRLSIDR